MELEALTIVSVPVSDQDRALTFYQEVLGFSVVADSPMGPDRRWVQLRPPGGGTSITLVTWFETMPAGSLRGLVLGTPTLDRTHRELAARTEVSPIRDAPWGRYCTLADPDGNAWVVQETPAGRAGG